MTDPWKHMQTVNCTPCNPQSAIRSPYRLSIINLSNGNAIPWFRSKGCLCHGWKYSLVTQEFVCCLASSLLHELSVTRNGPDAGTCP